MKIKYSRFRHNAKQTSFTSPTGSRRAGDEQEHTQHLTNDYVTSSWSCRRPENVSILKVGTLGDKLQQDVAATRQIASCVLENFCENLCRCNRICRRNKSHRFSLIWFFATCCSDKILLRRQRFSQKFSGTHEAICRCNVSPRHVAATCRLVCTDLKFPTVTSNVTPLRNWW